MVCRKLAACFALTAGLAVAQPLPEFDERIHEGVASCASSVCHGKTSQAEDSPVWLNEYRFWLRRDYHSRAYKTLETEQSRRIAEKLGLPSATSAKICLDCHADNVASNQRGRRFQITDGVGCEACHGGSQDWLESHAEAGTSHTDNILNGLYPTDQPVARAKLCLSCHLGTQEKFASHEIMGAGHPRLSFDLLTFTANQPAHYTVDDDYLRRGKIVYPATSLMLAGLVLQSQQSLALLNSPLYPGHPVMPELAFYQCHDCHHSMASLRWQSEGGPDALPPGTVRLNDGPLTVLMTATDTLGWASSAELENGWKRLHRASQTSVSELQAEAAKLVGMLEPMIEIALDTRVSADDQRALRRQLLDDAAAGRYRHFTAAELAFLAVESLSINLGDEGTFKQSMDNWYETLADEDAFSPQQFALSARSVSKAL